MTARKKASTINARVPPETRLALEAEAERSGRSLSATIELWLELGRRVDMVLDAIRGGSRP